MTGKTTASMLDTHQVDCLSRIDALAHHRGMSLYMVGGVVRDLLRGVTVTDCDLDILVDGNAIEFAEEVQREIGGELKVFKNFFTAKILTPSSFPSVDEIDFASARTEVYQSPGALPTVSLAPLADDLRRRDFSTNAMALPLSVVMGFSRGQMSYSQLADARIDPFNGFTDLQNRRIRVLHDRSFIDDPTRLFRAIRYVVRIGGELEEHTAHLFCDAIVTKVFSSVSLRRKLNELQKVFSEIEIIECVERCIVNGVVQAAFEHPDIDFDKTDLEKMLRSAAFFLSSGHTPLRLEVLVLMLFLGAAAPTHRIALMRQLSVAKDIRAICESDITHAEKDDSAHQYSVEGDAYRIIVRKAMRAAE